MVKRPTGSGGEPSSPNCGVSAGVKARHLLFIDLYRMSYLVLARKYRPKNFTEMVGQEHVVQALTNALTQQRLHHAYLFTGTRGVGKTTVSRILAKSLNCQGADGQGGITATPCGVCQACSDIDAGRFVDYTELDAASNRGVDEIAQLLEQAVYKPVQGRFKVFMIDEVHMLSNTAFNAMLKTLEEPPEYLKFVLATTDPQKVPVTVLSRCLQFNLRPMAPETVLEHLLKVLQAENINADTAALQLLARASRGSMRDALSLTDQAIAFGAGSLSESGIRQMLGTVDRSHVLALVDALAAGDGRAVVDTVNALRINGLSAASTLEEMTMLLQRMTVFQLAPSAVAQASGDDQEAARLSKALPPDETQLLYSLCLHGRTELGLAPDEYAALVMVLLRLLAFKPGVAKATGHTAANSSAVAGGATAPVKKPFETHAAEPAQPVVASAEAPSAVAAATPIARPAVAAQLTEKFKENQPLAGVESAGEATKVIAVPLREQPESSARLERKAEVPPGAVGVANPELDEFWIRTVQQLIDAQAIAALVRELATQSQLVQRGEQHWRLQVEQAALSQVNLRDKLQSTLAAQGHDVALTVQVGPVADSWAKRSAAAQAEKLAKAEAAILGDEFVQRMMREYGAKIVPGSIKAI
jgi:DNA polymerase III subunit gamma/tau